MRREELLSNSRAKKITQLDVVIAWTRHIASPKAQSFFVDIMAEIRGTPSCVALSSEGDGSERRSVEAPYSVNLENARKLWSAGNGFWSRWSAATTSVPSMVDDLDASVGFRTRQPQHRQQRDNGNDGGVGDTVVVADTPGHPAAVAWDGTEAGKAQPDAVCSLCHRRQAIAASLRPCKSRRTESSVTPSSLLTCRVTPPREQSWSPSLLRQAIAASLRPPAIAASARPPSRRKRRTESFLTPSAPQVEWRPSPPGQSVRLGLEA